MNNLWNKKMTRKRCFTTLSFLVFRAFVQTGLKNIVFGERTVLYKILLLYNKMIQPSAWMYHLVPVINRLTVRILVNPEKKMVASI